MQSSCLQGWRVDYTKKGRYQLPGVKQLRLSENDVPDFARTPERLRFWKQWMNHVVAAVFICLAFRVLLNAVTGFTLVALLNGQVLQNDNGTFEFVQHLSWATPGLSLARGLFWYGLPAAELLGGMVAIRRGHPRMFGVGVATTSLLALLVPTVFHATPATLTCLLFAARLVDALLVRNLELVWGSWVPMDRKWHLAFSYSGILWGDLAAAMLLQWVPDPFVSSLLYYILGCIGLLMCVLWWMAVKKVNIEKRLSSSQKKQVNNVREVGFCQVVMSLPVLALIVAVKGNFWSYITLESSVPAYFIAQAQWTLYVPDVLCYEDGPPEYLSLGQHLATLLVLYVFIFIATTEAVSEKVVRKSYVCMSLAVNGGLLFLVPYLRSATGVMAVATTVHICSAIAYNTSLVNVLEIAPRFSPIIVGLLMVVGAVCSPLAPSVTQYMTQDHTIDEWKKVYFISGGAALTGALMYLMFGHVEIQKWAVEVNEELPLNDQQV